MERRIEANAVEVGGELGSVQPRLSGVVLRRCNILVLNFEGQNPDDVYSGGRGSWETYAEVLMRSGGEWTVSATVPGRARVLELTGDSMPELVFEQRDTREASEGRPEVTKGNIVIYAFSADSVYYPGLGPFLPTAIRAEFEIRKTAGAACEEQGSDALLTVEEAPDSLPVVVLTTERFRCNREPQVRIQRYRWNADRGDFVRLPT